MLPFLCKPWGRGEGGEVEDQKREKYDSWHTATKNHRENCSSELGWSVRTCLTQLYLLVRTNKVVLDKYISSILVNLRTHRGWQTSWTSWLLFWSHCVNAGLVLIASVHDVVLSTKWAHAMWIFAASRSVHSLIKFSTEKWLHLSSNTVSGCATVYEACHCHLAVEAEDDLRPLHANFRWNSGAGTGFSPSPSCFPSQYLSICAPNSYFIHLPPMLYDPTNWHHICHWHRTLHAERHHKHDMRL